ncbi:GNAT family N-acetyltransferase [Peteryoungia ipomoeae]|uniref:GNAT family N-acetyltransferase n=1 Tax=Peteryoungia ipomoeae TaxID=1210932 RepID=A0A4S8P5P4_9HYPH|nr:GNAT family N-acetyltransferase [Peteryoungia ipomoeae]THV25523.1 GNAT family N-acetyltransferase [Peteryoungia ipomoeae]
MVTTAELVIRQATEEDIDAIIALFADDLLGGHGDTTDPALRHHYLAAFEKIAASPNEALYVAVLGGAIVGTFQTLVTTSFPGRGSSAMIVEAVQTRSDMRGRGIGKAMLEFAVNEARQGGMAKVQLTSNVVRTDAHRFYQRLGFEASHIGFKRKLK